MILYEDSRIAAECATWPEDLRHRWIWGHGVRLSRWAVPTRYHCSRTFSTYLEVLRRSGLGDQDPLLTPEGVRAFVLEHETKVSERTLAGYVSRLVQAAIVLYPDEVRAGSFDWLYETRKRFVRVAKGTPKQRHRNVTRASDLIVLARALLSEAEASSGHRAILLYRAGLFILVGQFCPERRRALAGIKLSDLDLERAVIQFPSERIKTKGERRHPLTPELIAALRRWISDYRPRWALESEDALFVTRDGTACSGKALYRAMVAVTGKRLGIRVSPHLMRNAAAVSVIEQDPSKVALASHALGHRDRRTTAIYTETARAVEASRSLQSSLKQAAEASSRQLRPHQKSNPPRASNQH